jgi:hypothetical protein
MGLMDQVKLHKTCRLSCLRQHLAWHVVVGRASGQVWNQTDFCLLTKPELLAGYLDPLPTQIGWLYRQK